MGVRQTGVVGAIVLALGGMVLSLTVAVLGGKLLAPQVAVVVEPPVAGRWLAMNSPATKVPSHGMRAYGQAYAIDLVYEPESIARPAFGSGAAMPLSTAYAAFGQPVRSMVDGVVVQASDGQRDHRARSRMLAVVYLMVEGALRALGGPRFIVGTTS